MALHLLGAVRSRLLPVPKGVVEQRPQARVFEPDFRTLAAALALVGFRVIWPLLFAAAITVVWVEGSLFAPLRTRGPKLWQALAGCALCSGVWIGMGIALLSGERVWWQVLGMGCLSACAALAYVLWTDKLVAPRPPGASSLPPAYVSADGVVQVPEELQRKLGLAKGGGVVFVERTDTGHVEMLTNQQFAELFEEQTRAAAPSQTPKSGGK